tara:strand:+ start:136 stop:708 length:573 start_codon:yes stop_codon:yes gene_type:complete
MGTPALLAAQSSKILSAANQSAKALYRHSQLYGLAEDGTTGPAAAGWVVTLSVASPVGIIQCPSGTAYEVAAVTDDTSLAQWDNSGAAAAMDNVAAIVYDCHGGSAVLTAVWGTAAAVGSAEAPTDSEIAASLGSSEFVRVADVLASNSAAAVATQTWDNTARSGFGNVDAGFDGDLATSETAWNSSLSS